MRENLGDLGQTHDLEGRKPAGLPLPSWQGGGAVTTQV